MMRLLKYIFVHTKKNPLHYAIVQSSPKYMGLYTSNSNGKSMQKNSIWDVYVCI